MKKLLLALLLFAGTAQAQSVQQSGSVTGGHATRWITNGVVGDAGTAQNPSVTSFGVVNSGGPGICVNSGATGGPYNALCLSASTSSAGIVSLYAYGGATAQPLQLCTQGECLTVPVSGGTGTIPTITTPTVVDSLLCGADTLGNLKDCGSIP